MSKLKIWAKKDIKCFKTIFEQATAGTYSISIPSGYYLIELVGGGGGCAGCRWASNVGNGNTMLSGGSGAYYKGILYISAGTYTITVGAGKPVVTSDSNTLTTAQAGGDTSFGSLVIAGGGKGGQAEFYTRIAGVGGTCNINVPTFKNIIAQNGNTGREAGSAVYTFTTVAGGVSAYDSSSTGYGAGGGYPNKGIDGYCRIMQQTTADDYEVIDETITYKLPAKKDREYYKYQYNNWTQPTLTSNGTLGSNSFACSDNSTLHGPVFNAFNAGNTKNVHYGAIPATVIFYNPIPLNVAKIVWTVYDTNRNPTNYTVQGSNDGVNYVNIITNQTASASATTTMTMSNNTGYYKYYKIIVNAFNTGVGNLKKLDITAKTRTVISGTVVDYDFYEDITTYYGIGG